MRRAPFTAGGLIVLVVASIGCTASPTVITTTTSVGNPTTIQARAPTTTSVSTTTTTTLPAPPNEVVIGLEIAPATLNPFSPAATQETLLIAEAHMAGVHEVGPDLELLPVLVDELPSMENGMVVANGDGSLSVEWRIRPDATWSDGEPITGHDLLFTWEAMVAVFPDAGPQWLTEPLPALVDGIATDDSAQLTFAESDFRYELLFPYVLPQHAVEDTNVAADWDDASWPAAGPFIVDVWDPGSGAVRLVSNDRYRRTDRAAGDALPHLDAVTFVPPPNGNASEWARRFDVDVAPLLIPEGSGLDSLEEDGVTVVSVPSRIWEHVAWQFGPADPVQDDVTSSLLFRRAVATALSAREIADAAAEMLAEPPSRDRPASYLPGGSEGGWQSYTTDAAAAAALLDEACAGAGRDCTADPPVLRVTVTRNATLRPLIGREIERRLEETLGIEVEVDLQDSMAFFGAGLSSGTWDTAVWAWLALPGRSGTLQFLHLFEPVRELTGAAPYGWGVAGSTADGNAVDRYRNLLAAANATIDPGEFDALAAELIQILADEVVMIPLASRPTILGWRADAVDGVVPHGGAIFTWNIEEWHRPGE